MTEESHADAPISPDATLLRDRAFWGMCLAQFLGAFNDNVTKQLALLVCLRETDRDQQAQATAVFALPFLLFSGFAGFLADRISKTNIVRGCKAAEVAIQAAGLSAAFAALSLGGLMYQPLLVVLFLMGAHSAVFGPPKYGILPELFRKSDLPHANGVFLTTTFLAIVFGWVFAGWLIARGGDSLPIGVLWGCSAGIGIALLGLAASLLVRKTPAAQPNLRFGAKDLAVDPASWRLVLADRWLFGAFVVNGVFYFCGGVIHPAVNALGVKQLGLSEAWTSAMLGCVAVGIAIGCLAAGALCRGKADLRVAKLGALLAGLSAALLGSIGLAANAGDGHARLAAGLLLLLGVGGGLLAVPLAVTIQTRAPVDHKGRVLAAMSWCNWIGVLTSAAFYQACLRVRDSQDWPPSAVFPAVALPLIAVAVLLPPRRDVAG